MIYVDSIFSIGKEHKICEDYVLINKEKIPFIIVSDGCSSSNNTDIGSRIISINTKNFIEKNYKEIIINKEHLIDIFKRSLINIDILKLKEEALDATLLFAFIYNDELHYFVIGDGIVSYKIGNKKVIQDFSFKDEKVFYGNYFNNLTKFNFYNQSDLSLNIETIEIENNHSETKKVETKDFIYYNKIKTSSLEYFFLSTDGLLTASSNKEIAKTQFINFLSFKNLRGDFIQRRYKMWNKKISKEGLQHLDDVGIAGFSFFKEEDK